MLRKTYLSIIGMCGVTGVIMLITSFIINPGPPPNATIVQIVTFGKQYYNSIIIGAWLQAVSPALIVIFAFAIVHLAGAEKRLVGWVTFFGGIILVTVSLIEVTFYLSAVNSTNENTMLVSLELIKAVQHLFSIIAAPLLFISLSSVILSSNVLPHFFGYIGFILGFLFTVLGFLALFYPIQYIINYISIIQGIWWLAASLSIIMKARKI